MPSFDLRHLRCTCGKGVGRARADRTEYRQGKDEECANSMPRRIQSRHAPFPVLSLRWRETITIGLNTFRERFVAGPNRLSRRVHLARACGPYLSAHTCQRAGRGSAMSRPAESPRRRPPLMACQSSDEDRQGRCTWGATSWSVGMLGLECPRGWGHRRRHGSDRSLLQVRGRAYGRPDERGVIEEVTTPLNAGMTGKGLTCRRRLGRGIRGFGEWAWGLGTVGRGGGRRRR